jgi:hypothetical protein
VIALFSMAFLHVRHQMVAAVAVPLLLAEPLSGAVRSDVGGARLAPAFIVALALLAGVRWGLPVSRNDSGVAPLTALAHVPPALRATPVLNDYSFGGYLIFVGVKPFIDSRAELYGESTLETYAALVRPDRTALEAAIRRYAIRWSILKPSSPIVAELDATPGWRRLYADRFAVVQFRDGAAR